MNQELRFILYSLILICLTIVFTAYAHNDLRQAEMRDKINTLEKQLEKFNRTSNYIKFYHPENAKYAEKTAALLIKLSEKYDADIKLLIAVAEQESKFNPYALGRAGDYSYMQVTSRGAWAHCGRGNFYNVKDSADTGIRYLLYLKRIYNGNIQRALLAYNSGPSITFDEQWRRSGIYLARVNENYRKAKRWGL